MDGDGGLHPVPDHRGLGGPEDIHLLQGFFAAQLLDDADDGVDDDHAQEGQVEYGGPHGDQRGGQQSEYQVEIGQQIGADDLARGADGRRHLHVAPAGLGALGCLGGGEALGGVGLQNREVPAIRRFVLFSPQKRQAALLLCVI